MESMKLIKCFLFLVLAITYTSADCQISANKELSAKSPIFLDGNNELWLPDSSFLRWKTGEQSTIFCSGPKNFIKEGKIPEGKITCQSNSIFSLNGKKVDLKNLECEKVNTALVKNLKDSCENGGTKHQIGFETSSSTFFNIMDICYDLTKSSVVNTNHIIPGKAINGSLEEKYRPNFSSAGIPKTSKPAVSYLKTSQLTRFSALLGDDKTAEKYLNSSSFLSKGHLVPDADAVYHSWQLATYFFMNAAPQWQSVNSKNWIRVENFARKKASLIQDNLEVYTGVAGNLQLQNNKKKLISMSLNNDDLIVVPKYYWKILKYNGAAIAFVTLNNPFATDEEEVCKSICDKYNWYNPDFDLYTKGKTYCCTTKDLRKAFPKDVPSKAVTNKILPF